VLLAALGERERAGAIPRAEALLEAIRADIGASSQNLIARGEELFAEPPASFARQVLAERG
jgi:hypothetical protein